MYKCAVAPKFHIGDVIRRAREQKKWNQERLGEEAARYQLDPKETKINKSTVSKVETDPYSSELGTIWRLMSALNLSFTEVEESVGNPLIQAREAPDIKPRAPSSSERRTAKRKRTG